MTKYVSIITAFLFFPAALSADFGLRIDGPADTGGGNPPVYVTQELGWDSGIKSYSICWYDPTNRWLAVDFDASDVTTTPVITKARFFTRDDWPNEGYDGFKVAIYSWSNDEPGTIIWPEDDDEGQLFVPGGLPHGDVWADMQINWTYSDPRFVVAVNQYYDEPDCDPLALDDNDVPSEHSWMFVNNDWDLFDPSSLNIDYANLMIRAVVQDMGTEHTFTPASFGQIKALYK
ncbi:MAG: hypothetical protein JSW52_01535 [Candidatus Coatesbacteria bacterium]|nr:MAG: hypothetical protein JSW52_01535 [Candidatus Coatesbacteria bacterium]